MYLDNLAPLLHLWPLLPLLVIAVAAMLWQGGGRRRGGERDLAERDRLYWAAEFTYRARMRAKEWLTRTKTPRLTYQGPPIEAPARYSAKRRK